MWLLKKVSINLGCINGNMIVRSRKGTVQCQGWSVDGTACIV